MDNYIETTYMPKKPQKGYLAFTIFFLCVGLGLIIGIIVANITTSAKLKTYVTAEAKVIDYKITTSWEEGRETKFYAEIVQFDVGGETYTATNGISSTSGVVKIGDTLQIAYNPQNPNDCIFITANNKLGLTVALVIGLIFTLVAGGMLIVYFMRYRDWKSAHS